jgi:hypothetical protein
LLLAFGFWLLAIGFWLLAIGYWLLAVGLKMDGGTAGTWVRETVGNLELIQQIILRGLIPKCDIPQNIVQRAL